ncbi:MAG: hypothetical protein JO199_04435, partial [Candidatus Eremiobacteraeota bacterium]|nr:hypothetical protein [Candidatus Eremiobacteraeota bacterium]
ATEYGGTGGAAGCSVITDPWLASQSPSCNGTDMLLSTAGTYTFFVYDTITQQIVDTVYLNAGQVFSIAVYGDSYHTQTQYQFDESSSTAAYIYLTNVAPSDYYVVEVMYNGVTSYCVAQMPPGSQAIQPPTPTGTTGQLLCNPATSNVTGNQAPGGSLSVTWTFPVSSNLPGGAYNIIVYDQTANAVLGQTQVTLIAPGNSAILLAGTASTEVGASPGPNAATTTSYLAYDGKSDFSVSGVAATTQQQINAGTYTWSITNPEGKTLGTASVTTGSKGTMTNTFTFSNYTLQPPGEYPSNIWALQLYQPSTQTVVAASSFQLLGYHATTRFLIGGTLSAQLNFPTNPIPTATPAELEIINDSNTYFNGYGDSIGQGNGAPAIIITEDTSAMLALARTTANLQSSTLTGIGTTAGQGGVIFTPTAAENCIATAPCTEVVQDSSNNNWNAKVYCSETVPNNVAAKNDGCLIEVTPAAAGTVLAPGANIKIPLVWDARGGDNTWACYNVPCNVLTSILPTHGLTWSLANNATNPVAWTPITIGSVNAANAQFGGTARVDYIGGGTCTSGCVAQGTTPVVSGAHYYEANVTRAELQNSTPFTAGSRKNVLSVLVTNTSQGNAAKDQIISSGGSPTLAIGFPSYISASSVTTDASSTGTWGATVACPSSFGSTFVCWKGPTINGGCSSPYAACQSTLKIDLPEPVSSFSYNELTVEAYGGEEFVWFTLTNDTGTGGGNSAQTTTDGAYTVDSIGLGAYSLNSSLMSAAFTPSVVGTGQNPTTFNVSIANTSTSADPFPDSIDEVVLEQTTSSTYTVNGVPALSGAGANWAYKTTYVGSTANTLDYVFSVCPATPTKAQLAPQINSIAVPLSANYAGPATCAPETQALQSSNSGPLQISMKLNGVFSAGSLSFNMYAHGANTGAWSAPKTFSVTLSGESASAGFSTVAGSSVSTNTLPTLTSAPPQTFVYTVTNTSASTKVHTIKITLPGKDINGTNAWDGTANGYWELVGPIASTITLGGSGLAGSGCTVNTNGANTFSASTSGANGQIEVDCGAGLNFTNGSNALTISFQSYYPSTQSDTYSFPSTVDGVSTGPTWIGDQDVAISFSLGLTVVVNPHNPGPGGSTPNVQCTSCAFSGSTVDFGPIGVGNNVAGQDIVRASVIYSGATNAGNNWTLSFSANNNPACLGGAPDCGAIASELLGQVDGNNTPLNANGCGAMAITAAVNNTYIAVPLTGSPQSLVTGPENKCVNAYGAVPYDTIESYKVQVGTEGVNGEIVTVTYTLVAQ